MSEVEIIENESQIIEISDDDDSTDVIVLNSVEEESSEDNKAHICVALKDEQEVNTMKKRKRRFRACRQNTTINAQTTDSWHGQVNKVAKSSAITDNSNEIRNSAVLEIYSNGSNSNGHHNINENYIPISDDEDSKAVLVINSVEEESSEDNKAHICIALKDEQEVNSTKKRKRRFRACRQNTTINAQTTDSGHGQVNKVAKSTAIIDNSAVLENYSNGSNSNGHHNINEIYTLTSDDEDSKDIIVINSVEEEASENDKAHICIKLKDEQEEVHMAGFTSPVNNDTNLDNTITDLINNLDYNCTNTHTIEESLADRATYSVNNLYSNIHNTNSTKKRKRRRRRFRACRRNTTKTSQNTDSGNGQVNKESKSSIIIKNSNEIHNSAVLKNYSNGSNNNVQHNINENYNSIVNELPNCSSNIEPDLTESATNRSNNYDFSKLKWLKPLTNLSSPAHLQIVIIDRNHPNWRITNDKWFMIEKRLLEALNSEMLRTNDTNIGLFDGAKWHRGIKIVGCHNKNAFNFITKFILKLDKLWCGAKLDVFPITYITRHVVKVYIPPPTVKTEVILSLIQLQNPSIHGEDLKVLRECERANNGGVDIWFSVNDDTFTNLCILRGEIKYGINRIFFKPSH